MTRSTPIFFLRALRPRQWVKNVLVAAAPVAASSLDEVSVVADTLVAFVVFTAAAGATYLLNDAADVDVDRLHPTKQLRPVAAGHISVAGANRAAAALGAAALIAGAIQAPLFGLVIAAYLAVNAWYSAGMKHRPGLELVAVASGFILRAAGGGAATGTPLSLWFVLVVCASSLFIVAGKRSGEMLRTAGANGRMVLAQYSLRGLRLVRAVSASVAVVGYALWVFAHDLANPWWSGVSLVPFAFAFARYSTNIERGLGESPEDLLFTDRRLQLAALAWAFTYGVAVYG